MNNETNKDNSSILLAVAIVGWLAFVATVVYGVTVYGPAKHKLGLEAPAPSAFSEKAFPNGDPTFIPPTILPITATGVLQELNGQQLVIESDLLTEKKIFSVIAETKFIKRIVVSSEVIEENGLQITTGKTEDKFISIADLRIGDNIQFTFREDEDGENELLELIVF